MSQWTDCNFQTLEESLSSSKANERIEPALARLFASALEMRAASQALAGTEVMSFEALAKRVFGTEGPEAATGLAGLISIGIRARLHPEAFSLLPARYHFFTNGIDNVTVRLAPGGEGFSEVRIGNQFEENGQKLYRLLVCRKCGQPYVEGVSGGAELLSTLSQGSSCRAPYFWLGEPTAHFNDEDDDCAEGTANPDDIWQLNPLTGEINPVTGQTVPMRLVTLTPDDDGGGRYLRKCPACGGTAGTDAEAVTGFHRELCALRRCHRRALSKTAGKTGSLADARRGRRLLAFSDNRQDAAFFAPYLQRTNQDILLRWAVMRADENPGAQRLNRLTSKCP